MTEIKEYEITPTPSDAPDIYHDCKSQVDNFFEDYVGDYSKHIENLNVQPDCENILLKKYKFVKPLGGGGSAGVIEVKEVSTGQHFAVKVLPMSPSGYGPRSDYYALCATSRLVDAEITENFPKLHEAILCRDAYKRYTSEDYLTPLAKLRWLHLIMTKIDKTFDQVDEFKISAPIAFEYVYAYYVLRKYAHMIIDDIKWRNLGLLWTKYSRAYHIWTGKTEDVYLFPPGPMFVHIDLGQNYHVADGEEDDLKKALYLPIGGVTDYLEDDVVGFNAELPRISNGFELAQSFRKHFKQYMVDPEQVENMNNVRHFRVYFSDESL